MGFRLLVVEDDPKIASLIARGMADAGFAVDLRPDGEAGLAAALGGSYDAAIVDVVLPGLGGLEMIERLRAAGGTLPVLILSARQSVDDRVTGLQRGGDDYLVKPFSFSELLARVEALLRRDRGAGEPTQLAYGGLFMDLLRREVRRDGEKIDLPAREYALLEYLLRNPETVVAKTAILERIYEYRFDPQTNVVDVLVCRLRDRIDRGYETKLIHTVRGMGYVLRRE